MANTSTFRVEGMHCGHCVRAVRSEVATIGNVTGVEVDLETGRVTVASDGAVDENDVRAAVAEAGYEVIS